MTQDFLAKRMKPISNITTSEGWSNETPIWDLFNDKGEDIGCLTCFDGEGFVATVKDKTGHTAEVSTGPSWKGGTIRECLALAREALVELQDKENLDLLTTDEFTEAQAKRDLKEYTAFHAIECNMNKEECEFDYDMRDIGPRDERIISRRSPSYN
tara:strand:+ start:13 stop:480 length:468 start_codon:yes stop_codon:yes gene_type:complete